MSVTVTGKLNKPAHQFQAGDSIGFGIRIGQRYYDRETKQNEWTNYEAAVFAKNPDQIQFYQNALVEGAIVEITGKEQKIKQFQGNNGLSLSIEILGASIGFIGQSAPAQQQGFPQGQPMQQSQGFQQPQQAPQQQPQGFGQPQQQAPQGGFQQQAPQQGGFGNPSGQQALAPQAGGWDDFDDNIGF